MKLLKAALLLMSVALFIAALCAFDGAQRIRESAASLERDTLAARAQIGQQEPRKETLANELDDVLRVEESIAAARKQCCADAKLLEDLILAGKSKRKIGYLTFDDGPYADKTGRLLELLDSYGIKATFFVVGKGRGEAELAYITAQALAGHTVANHTYTHIMRGGVACIPRRSDSRRQC